MAQHYLLSTVARTLSLAKVARQHGGKLFLSLASC
jgi:hypothetical protein